MVADEPEWARNERWALDVEQSRFTAEQLVSMTFPAPRYAVPGLIAEGLNLLAGPPKVGKSWLALAIGVAVASGGMALGKIPVDKGQVLYLALEDSPRRLQTRLGMVLGPDPAPTGLILQTSWPRFGDGACTRLRETLDEHPDTRLVVVDVYAQVRDVSHDRGNAYLHEYAESNALKLVADEYGVAFLVVHHTRKQASEDFVDMVSGTNGIAGAADAVLVLKRSRTAADAVLSITGRDVVEADLALSFKEGIWSLLGSADEYALSDERRRVLELVRERNTVRPVEAASALGINHEAAKKVLARMAKADQLVTDGKGNYSEPVPAEPPSPLSLLSPQTMGDRDTGDRRDSPRAGTR